MGLCPKIQQDHLRKWPKASGQTLQSKLQTVGRRLPATHTSRVRVAHWRVEVGKGGGHRWQVGPDDLQSSKVASSHERSFFDVTDPWAI
jgi:hypothetical protein